MEPVRRYRCGWNYGGPAWMTAMANPVGRRYRLTGG